VPEPNLLEGLPALELAARAHLALAEFTAAEHRVMTVEHAAETFGTSYVAGRAKLLRAELATARRDHEQARRACEDSIDCLEEAAAVYDAARARAELAGALLALGRSERACAEAAAARAVFETLGAERDLAIVDELLDSGHAAADGIHTELTRREIEILRLIARGLRDGEIADELVVSRHTIHRHVANIRTKLRLPPRSAAVAYAAQQGVL
jgi:ATP/maltotriose-dependent transcriptional regulator MalT